MYFLYNKVITFGRIKRDHQTRHDLFYIAISWVRLFAGEAGTSAILSWVGLGVWLHLPSWLCGRGLVRSLGLGVLNTAACCGVGLLAIFWTSSCFGLGVRCLSTGAGAVYWMLDDSTFVFIVFVLRGALCRSHVPTNSPHGLFDDRGIPGKICPRSLLIGWVNPSKVDGLYRQEKMKTLSIIDYKFCIFYLRYAEGHTHTHKSEGPLGQFSGPCWQLFLPVPLHEFPYLGWQWETTLGTRLICFLLWGIHKCKLSVCLLSHLTANTFVIIK